MDERLKDLLRIVVEDVIETGEPVGSQRLVESYGLDVSPATIRNWFAELEDEGYLTQPHTSSGRVPTESGYRVYLEEIMKKVELRRRELADMERAAMELEQKADVMRRMAKAVADLTRDAVVIADRDMRSYAFGFSNLFGQPEFSTRDQLVHLGRVLDTMDEIVDRVMSRRFEEPTPLIGRDCPFGEECGSVFLTMHDGSLFGILGPLRMDYQRGIALLRTVKRLTSSNDV